MLLAAQEWMLEGETLEEKFAFARSAGFDGIELGARVGGEFAGRADRLREARSAGVVMSSAVVLAEHFIGDFDPAARATAIDDMRELLTTVAIAGGRGVVTPHAFGLFSAKLPPFIPPRSDEDSRSLLLEALGVLAEHAVAEGVQLFLEPLNRYEDFVVNTLADASWYVDAIASPGLAVVADTYHMSIEEAGAGDAIRAAGDRIRHVQLGDSNRLEPGAGHYDWDDTLDALHDIGYDGWLALECGLSGPAADVLPSAARVLRRGDR